MMRRDFESFSMISQWRRAPSPKRRRRSRVFDVADGVAWVPRGAGLSTPGTWWSEDEGSTKRVEGEG